MVNSMDPDSTSLTCMLNLVCDVSNEIQQTTLVDNNFICIVTLAGKEVI